MLAILTAVWPFHIALAEGVEIYLPVTWTAAASAYVLGAACLPVYWVAALLGFGLIVVLDRLGVVSATGLAAENIKRWRGEPFDAGSGVDGNLRHFTIMSENAVRLGTVAVAHAAVPDVALPAVVALAEGVVILWLRVLPIPGRMAPRRMRARIADALGHEALLATESLHVVMVAFLLVAYRAGGIVGFAAASASTIVLHAILKRLNDARVESERRRQALLEMRGELDRRQRLATIGQTASTIFHQIGRQHGTIGLYAHLLARGTAAADEVPDHGRRILESLEQAKRVIDELLRFGEDRALNLYSHSLTAVAGECVEECRLRAAGRGVTLTLTSGADAPVVLDKHKLKQAIGNLLDNAIEATPQGAQVDVDARLDGGALRVTVRDHGTGIPPAIRGTLFTPFVSTKPDGVGLGLALAKELVEAHGGRLDWAAADPGTVFTIRLPQEPAVLVPDNPREARWRTTRP